MALLMGIKIYIINIINKYKHQQDSYPPSSKSNYNYSWGTGIAHRGACMAHNSKVESSSLTPGTWCVTLSVVTLPPHAQSQWLGGYINVD